jgi:hypothetical protein
MGGLGNQIFQIFTTIAYAIKSRKQFKILNVYQLGGGSTTLRYTFWKSFFSNLKPFLIPEIPNKVHIIREKGYPYSELSPLEIVLNDDIFLYGYFQSYKYFQNEYSMITRIIGLNKMKDNLLTKLQKNTKNFEKNISMHFRIGDYKKIQQYHPIATYEFYERSLEHMQSINPKENFNIIYFCENVDIDDVLLIINKLLVKFPNYNFERGDSNLADWEQMLYMSLCNYNIIANSSFSWWAAYFNSCENKIVCYPSVWFGEIAKNDTKDLCPPEWIKINV